MGYRSDVYIKVKIEKYNELLAVIRQADLEDFVSAQHDEIYGYVEISYIKWYDDYPDVKLINDFIGTLKEDEGGMVIIGEDNATDEKGYPYNVDLYTVIEINGFNK